MLITKKYLKGLNPCESGWMNYLEHHADFKGTALEFAELENIPIEDKQWVLLRDDFLTDRQLHLYGCFCAERVLYFFEEKYPVDKRPHLAIQAKKDWIGGKITSEQLAAAWDAAYHAARQAQMQWLRENCTPNWEMK